MTDGSVVAVLVVRNERPYLWNCLNHLIDNQLRFFVIDNGSTDATAELLATRPFSDHLIGCETVPFTGVFDWERLVEAKEAVAARLEAEWVLFVSADEIMHSYHDGETLRAAIERIGASGVDVIDFNEFVFLPVDADYVVDWRGPQPLRHYYFFEPYSPRLMRARRRSLRVSGVASGGHVLAGEPFRLASEQLALRHYIFRDQEHARRKYAERVFQPGELARGWHSNRVDQPVESFDFPPLGELHRLAQPGDRELCRHSPRRAHYWQWSKPADRSSGR